MLRSFLGDRNDHVLLEPDWSKSKPSFSDQEYPKSINSIMPEKVAKPVLDLLNIKNDLKNIKLFI